MPIYEYRCQKCSQQLEVMQKLSDPAPATCPSCGAENSFERLVSRTSFQLKGSGWYSDLYSSAKKESGSKPAEGDSKSPSGNPAPTAASSATSTPSSGGSGSAGSGSSSSGSSGSGSSGSGAGGSGGSGSASAA